MLKDQIFQDDGKIRSITFHNLKYCEAIVKKYLIINSFQVLLVNLKKQQDINDQPVQRSESMNIIGNNNPDRWISEFEGFESKKHSFIIFGKGVRIRPGTSGNFFT